MPAQELVVGHPSPLYQIRNAKATSRQITSWPSDSGWRPFARATLKRLVSVENPTGSGRVVIEIA